MQQPYGKSFFKRVTYSRIKSSIPLWIAYRGRAGDGGKAHVPLTVLKGPLQDPELEPPRRPDLSQLLGVLALQT
jgi:hypothetical protein